MSVPSRKAAWWIGGALVALVAVALYIHFDVGRLLTIEHLKESREALQETVQARPLLAALAFLGIYVAVAALSIPGATVLTLAAGAVFGLVAGLLLAWLAASVGALLAFLAARYLFRDAVQKRFGKKLAPINDGMARDGTFYLLSLRLVPLVPFWLVNLLSGLTPIGAWRYYVVSLVGMLPGTLVYVNAGLQLGTIDSPGDILSWRLIASFALLAVFPLLARSALAWWKRRKVYAGWQRPSGFDRNLVVIGAGAGGLVSAFIAAAVKAEVTLVEGHKMGGDCLNYGCVPSKALIRSARLAKQIATAGAFGIRNAAGEVDFRAVMARIRGVVRDIEPHDSVERYTSLGVEVLLGRARITGPWSVDVELAGGGKRTLTTRNIVVAAGASPAVPPIPGLGETPFLTSDTVWALDELPKRLVVLGGGPIGCELAQSFARLGSQVTQVEMAPRLLMREDADVSALVSQSLRADGVTVLTGHQAVRVEDRERLVVKKGERETAIPFDRLLCATGRAPRVSGYGLEELGIALTGQKTIETDALLRTRFPNIYAVGDVAGPFQFTHTAAHQAWYAVANALFGGFKTFKADYSVIPWATFTEPEVARVGLSQGEAKEQGVDHDVTTYRLADLDRAIADGTAHGFVRVLTEKGKDRILGVTIVGEHAGDLLAEYVLAMKHGLGLNKIVSTIHSYPTLAEANKYAAGEWKRAHAPQRLLQWAKRYHAWQRA